MKTRFLSRIVLYALVIAFALAGLTSCAQTPVEETEQYRALQQQVEELTAQLEEAGEVGELRVFYNGNSDVWLFPDGTFIMNYFHNTKFTGTYEETMNPDGDDSAIAFTHNGTSFHRDGTASFEPSGDETVTVIGGIEGNYLTIPEDWEDDHGHGNIYRLRETLVFTGPGENRITLNVDRTFVAQFNNGVKIIGYYAVRAFALDHSPDVGEPMPYVHNSVTFIPGKPTFSVDGEILGAVLPVPITEAGTELTIPEPWIDVAGADTFTLAAE